MYFCEMGFLSITFQQTTFRLLSFLANLLSNPLHIAKMFMPSAFAPQQSIKQKNRLKDRRFCEKNRKGVERRFFALFGATKNLSNNNTPFPSGPNSQLLD